MTELLTAAQMRAIEQAAIASGEVTGLELMERAGRGVVEAIFEEWPELKAEEVEQSVRAVLAQVNSHLLAQSVHVVDGHVGPSSGWLLLRQVAAAVLGNVAFCRHGCRSPVKLAVLPVVQ